MSGKRRTGIAIAGGLLFAALVFAFLAAIQPVNSDRQAIKGDQLVKFKLTPPPKKAPPVKKPEPERKVIKKPPPKKKPKRAVAKRTTQRPVRTPSAAPRLRAPSTDFSGMKIAASGIGGGGGAAINMDVQMETEEHVVEQELEQLNQVRREALRDDRNRFASASSEAASGAAAGLIPISTPKPTYPEKARRKNIEGVVQLSLLIDVDGHVEKHKIEFAQPEGYFEEAVVAVLPKWTFRSAKDENGRPIAKWITYTYPFVLEK